MAVIRATQFRQRNPLIEELEKQAQIAALRGQTTTGGTYAQEAMGGKFPIGNVANTFLSTAANIMALGQAKNLKQREMDTSNLVSEALNKGTVGTTEDAIMGNIPISVDDSGQFYTTRIDPELTAVKETNTDKTGGLGFKALTASILKDEGKTPETITIGKKDRTMIDKLKGELKPEEASNIGDLTRIGNLDAQTIELQRRLNLPKRTLVNGFLNGKSTSIIQEIDPRTNALRFTDLNGNPLDPKVVANFSTKKGSIPTLAEYIAEEAPELMQTGESDPSAAIRKATQIYNSVYGADAQSQQNISVQPSVTDPIEQDIDIFDSTPDAIDILQNTPSGSGTNTDNQNINQGSNNQSSDTIYEEGSKQEAETKKKRADTESTIVGTEKKKKEIEDLGLKIDGIKFDKIKDKQAFRGQLTQILNDLELAKSSAKRIIDNIQYGGARGFASRKIPGSDAFKLDQAILDLANQNLLRKLLQMKSVTPTGASGLGQLNQKEGDALRGSYGPLDFMRPDATLETANRIVKQLEQSIKNNKNYYKILYDEDFEV